MDGLVTLSGRGGGGCGCAEVGDGGEVQKLECAVEYSKIRATNLVDAHANKQVINEMVRQKHRMTFAKGGAA